MSNDEPIDPSALQRGFLVAGVSMLLLVLSLPWHPTRIGLPYGSIPALDLHNLYVFHHCELRNMPYGPASTGAECGDVGGRPMYYPPALYWSFVWLRLVSFESAVLIWRSGIVVGVLVSLLFWARLPNRRWFPSVVLFLLLLLPQFPLIFAAERGNNDVLIVILWTLSCLAMDRSRVTLAGFLAGAAVVVKVYPLFALAVVLGVLARTPERVLKFAGGASLAAVAFVIAFPEATVAYLGILREFAAQKPPALVYSHGLPSHLGQVGVVTGVGLLILWIVTGFRSSDRGDRAGVLAGALAISTFFSYTSYDYNLITTYPLLVVLFTRIQFRPDVRSVSALWILIVSVLGSREIFLGFGREKVWMEVLGLFLSALVFLGAGHSGAALESGEASEK